MFSKTPNKEYLQSIENVKDILVKQPFSSIKKKVGSTLLDFYYHDAKDKYNISWALTNVEKYQESLKVVLSFLSLPDENFIISCRKYCNDDNSSLPSNLKLQLLESLTQAEHALENRQLQAKNSTALAGLFGLFLLLTNSISSPLGFLGFALTVFAILDYSMKGKLSSEYAEFIASSDRYGNTTYNFFISSQNKNSDKKEIRDSDALTPKLV